MTGLKNCHLAYGASAQTSGKVSKAPVATKIATTTGNSRKRFSDPLPKQKLSDCLTALLVHQASAQHENVQCHEGGDAVLPLREKKSYPNSLANGAVSRAMPAKRIRLERPAMPAPQTIAIGTPHTAKVFRFSMTGPKCRPTAC